MDPTPDRLSGALLLGYLEHLVEEGEPCAIVTRAGLELQVEFVALEVQRKRLTVDIPELPPRVLHPGDAARLALPIGGHRWESSVRVISQEGRSRFLLSLPQESLRTDRRHAPRIPLSTSSGISATVHLDPQGPLLTGPLLDLSTGGFRFRVSRVLDLQERTRLSLEELDLAQGRSLDGVEILGLRETPLEAGGVIRDVAAGPILHVQFRALLHADRAFLRDWCDGRPPAPLPPPARRPLLLVMPEGPDRDDLIRRLEPWPDLTLVPAASVSEVRSALQSQRFRGALLVGPPDLLPHAVSLVRALRGARPCPIHAAAPAPKGCDDEFPQDAAPADLARIISLWGERPPAGV